MKYHVKINLLFFAVFFNFHLYSQTENSAVVSADLMNIFYIGIDNPISVAVPGISDDNVTVSVSNGTITRKENGKYSVRVDSGKVSVINVMAKLSSGVMKSFGSDTFRIKKIPDPLPCIGDFCYSNISISKEELIKNAELSVTTSLPFELKFEIKSFSMTFSKGVLLEKKGTGNKFSPEMIEEIKKLKTGDKVLLENIKASCPDGSVRTLSCIVILIVAN